MFLNDVDSDVNSAKASTAGIEPGSATGGPGTTLSLDPTLPSEIRAVERFPAFELDTAPLAVVLAFFFLCLVSVAAAAFLTLSVHVGAANNDRSDVLGTMSTVGVVNGSMAGIFNGDFVASTMRAGSTLSVVGVAVGNFVAFALQAGRGMPLLSTSPFAFALRRCGASLVAGWHVVLIASTVFFADTFLALFHFRICGASFMGIHVDFLHECDEEEEEWECPMLADFST
jgi:hypothetical protein